MHNSARPVGSTLADAPQSHGGLFFLYRGPLPY